MKYIFEKRNALLHEALNSKFKDKKVKNTQQVPKQNIMSEVIKKDIKKRLNEISNREDAIIYSMICHSLPRKIILEYMNEIDKEDSNWSFEKELAVGTKVEKEHTDSELTAKIIALDNLKEDPHYYSNLKKYGMLHEYEKELF